MITSAARGTPATLFEVIINVKAIASCCDSESSMCAACAIVRDAST